MEGDGTNAVWGVMDVLPRTDFPDVRKKCTIRSEHGTLLIIPREGDRMIRTYFEMPRGTNPKQVQLEDLQKMAQKLFQPYKIDFCATRWWSAYSISQRLARDMIDRSGHIFQAGDACHTHSPKAGQGMNASLQDGYNMGWKLGATLTGQADKKIFRTYIEERQQYARQLIEFDRYFAKLFSSTTDEVSADEFNQAFIKSGNFTAGMAANYKDSDLIDLASSQQDLAKNIIVGERMPTAQIVRKSDSKALQLQRLLRSDGRWRVIIFAVRSKTKTLCSD
jgi:phenol 2-monooxygenase (NADPH)